MDAKYCSTLGTKAIDMRRASGVPIASAGPLGIVNRNGSLGMGADPELGASFAPSVSDMKKVGAPLCAYLPDAAMSANIVWLLVAS